MDSAARRGGGLSRSRSPPRAEKQLENTHHAHATCLAVINMHRAPFKTTHSGCPDQPPIDSAGGRFGPRSDLPSLPTDRLDASSHTKIKHRSKPVVLRRLRRTGSDTDVCQPQGAQPAQRSIRSAFQPEPVSQSASQDDAPTAARLLRGGRPAPPRRRQRAGLRVAPRRRLVGPAKPAAAAAADTAATTSGSGRGGGQNTSSRGICVGGGVGGHEARP